jgi:hypothetical protein
MTLSPPEISQVWAAAGWVAVAVLGVWGSVALGRRGR